MSSRNIIEFSKVFQDSSHAAPLHSSGHEFELDQTIVLTFAHPWFAAIDCASTISLFKCGLFVKLITSIWSTLDDTTAKQCKVLGNIDSMYLPLPIELNSAISMIPWVETKIGVFKIKWPLTTLKTCFLNLQYFKKQAFNQLGLENPIGDKIPKLPGNQECFNRRFWGDDEGYEKVDFFISKYLASREDLPKLDKSYSLEEIDELIEESVEDYEDVRVVYKLYTLSKEERLDLLNNPEKDEQGLLEGVKIIGLYYCTVPIEILETDLVELMHVYDESNLKDIFFM
ncbi:hypothetical protein JA1_003164 [Spathaspora sp. JA1]|nr:hypothetical protein JA1_003164 [Spathaspora sp. JA1]